MLFLTRYSRRGASSRYRTLQYLPLFEAAGFRCTVSPLFDDAYLKGLYGSRRTSVRAVLRAFMRRLLALKNCGKFDVVVIEYEVFPYLPAIATSLLAWLRVPYIVDYDDAIFHRYDQHSSALVRLLLGRKISRVMNRAALVTVGNRYLANYAGRAGSSDVQMIPTVVDLNSYPAEPEGERDDSVFTIGWIGSPSTAGYLQHIAPALAEVCRHGGVRLLLVGSGLQSFAGVPTEVVPWDELTEVDALRKFDVGIMPLTDGPWERGKCGLKLVQYMACKLPVVASPVGVNTELVAEGVSGFLARDVDDWIRALSTLRDNTELRARMGHAGRREVEARYSLDVTAPRLVELVAAVARDATLVDTGSSG